MTSAHPSASASSCAIPWSSRRGAVTNTRARRSSARYSARGSAPAKRTPASGAPRPPAAISASAANAPAAPLVQPRDHELLALAARGGPGGQHAVEALLLRVGAVGDRGDVALGGRARSARRARARRRRPRAARGASARPPSLHGTSSAASRKRRRSTGRCQSPWRPGRLPAAGASKRIAPGPRRQQRRRRARVEHRPRAARPRAPPAAPTAPTRARSPPSCATRAPAARPRPRPTPPPAAATRPARRRPPAARWCPRGRRAGRHAPRAR